jgi:Domain of unknown function (DUF4395)
MTIFGFPDIIDGTKGRFFGGGASLLTAVSLATGSGVPVILLSVEYPLRLLFGPKSPGPVAFLSRHAAQLVGTKPHPSAGSPKQFAAACGATFALSSAVSHYAFPDAQVLDVRLSTLFAIGLLGATFLESALNYCVGCKIYHVLQKVRFLRPSLIPPGFSSAARADCVSIMVVFNPGAAMHSLRSASVLKMSFARTACADSHLARARRTCREAATFSNLLSTRARFFRGSACLPARSDPRTKKSKVQVLATCRAFSMPSSMKNHDHKRTVSRASRLLDRGGLASADHCCHT